MRAQKFVSDDVDLAVIIGFTTRLLVRTGARLSDFTWISKYHEAQNVSPTIQVVEWCGRKCMQAREGVGKILISQFQSTIWDG